MTHALPIPSGSRSVRPLHMQFAAPLRTAETCWVHPDDEVAAVHRATRFNRDLGLREQVVPLVTVAVLIFALAGAVLWQFS